MKIVRSLFMESSKRVTNRINYSLTWMKETDFLKKSESAQELDQLRRSISFDESEYTVIPKTLEILAHLKKKSSFDTRIYFFVHIIYIILVGIIGGSIIYSLEKRFSYLDCIFLSFSACTVTGLSTIETSSLKMESKIVLLVCIIMGMVTLTTIPLMLIKGIQSKKSVRNTQILNEVPIEEIEYFAYIYSIIAVLAVQTLFILSGFIIMGYHFSKNLRMKDPWWNALFLSFTSFSNCGLTIIDMSKFKNDSITNYTLILLILFGNTLFPAIYYLFIWMLYQLPTNNRNIFRFILDRHHRMSIHLFPTKQTFVYILSTILLLIIGTFLTIFFEYNNKDFRDGIFLVSFFHVVNTRMSGINTIELANLSLSTVLIFILLMRIKTQMFCSLDETTDIIEKIAKDEKKLKIIDEFVRNRSISVNYQYKLKKYTSYQENSLLTKLYVIIHDLRNKRVENLKKILYKLFLPVIELFNQVFSSVKNSNFWLIFAMIFITYLETNNTKFSLSKILFEIVSAYGNVGFSLGYVTSYSSLLQPLSKVVIIIIMIFGRHRGFWSSMKDQNVDFNLSYIQENNYSM